MHAANHGILKESFMERIDFISIGMRVAERRCRCGAAMIDIGTGVDCRGQQDAPACVERDRGLDGAARQLAIVLRDKMVRDAREHRTAREK